MTVALIVQKHAMQLKR